MAVYNPTSESSKINSIVADISYKGTRLGVINQFNPIEIKANQRTNILLPLQADTIGFGVLVKDIATNYKEVLKNAVLNIDGTVNVSGLPVSFTQTFKLT